MLPIAFRYIVHFRFETVGVVALVTAVAKEEFVLVIAAMAKLAVLEEKYES